MPACRYGSPTGVGEEAARASRTRAAVVALGSNACVLATLAAAPYGNVKYARNASASAARCAPPVTVAVAPDVAEANDDDLAFHALRLWCEFDKVVESGNVRNSVADRNKNEDANINTNKSSVACVDRELNVAGDAVAVVTVVVVMVVAMADIVAVVVEILVAAGEGSNDNGCAPEIANSEVDTNDDAVVVAAVAAAATVIDGNDTDDEDGDIGDDGDDAESNVCLGASTGGGDSKARPAWRP